MSATLSGVAQDADGYAVGFAGSALEVADKEGDKVGGHFRGSEEFEGVLAFARAGNVGFDGAVGDGGVIGVDDERDVVSGLECGLVEGGKRAARVGGLELRDGVVAMVTLGEIKAAQPVVEDAGVVDGESEPCRQAGLKER